MAIERYVPSLGGEIRYEHLHRYALARELVCGKSVLDLGCGEGYGAALLAQVAESVVGVDIDRECVTQAAQKYGDGGNVEFLVGACDAIPLPGESVDVVTCFETIEHHEQHEEMMREVKRILKPGGKLVVSSPNPVVYTEKAESSNPFHVKELYDYQLLSLLNRYFQQVKLYGQRLATGSFVFPMRHSQQQDWLAYTGEDMQVRRQVCELEEPKYFLAVAADVELAEVGIGSLYVDGQDDLLADLRQQLQALQANPSQQEWESSQAELERVRQELQETKSQLEKVQQERQQEQEECKQVKSELNETREKLEEWEFKLDGVQGDLADTYVQLQEKQQEVEKVRSEVQEKQQQWEKSQEQLQQEQQKRQQVQQELEESQQELQQEQQQRSQVQKQLEESQQNEQQIRKELQQLETERDRVQEQLQQSQQQYQQLETERDRLQEQLQQSQQQ
ncbi:class I SAM-dependent methyltransferase, partial [Geitlerinema sp. PCC 9228]|uniref:class I SAM-dependent methyltransferase n=1 Tax=Geitlerinema sp. PCC 9228 TaxID=111611 RepID=UPI0008F9996C